MAAESRLEDAGLSAPAGPEPLVVELASPHVGDDGDAARVAAAELDRVLEDLRDDPHSFGFFQAVRLLERLFPDRAHVGSPDPSREVVRFKVNPALGFPASEIQQLELGSDRATMMVNFMGLVGPQGVLPHQYSLIVSERLRARDTALADFLDMFHHRLLSLFYQAWRRYRFTIAREDGSRDALAGHLADLIGIGLDSTRDTLPFPDEALISRAGLLIAQARGAVALEQMLVDFFGVPAAIEQFVGGWYALMPTDRCVVGEDDDAANQLGVSAVAGDEVWDQQARVRVRLGPLTRTQYDSFLPGSTGYAVLGSLLRYFSHDHFDFAVQLVLAADEVPGVQLGTAVDEAQRLGWSTWLRSASRSRDADETILTLHSGAAS